MQIAVYADESGTHDPTGLQKGSREGTVGGIIAPVDDWKEFRQQWAEVLKNYSAPYFHFREWRDAEVVARTKREPSDDFKKNPYKTWSHKTLKDFAVELAVIAGSGNKLIVSTSIPTRNFHRAKLAGKVPPEENPYARCLDGFFADIVEVIAEQRAPWKRQPISFFFDRSDDAEWRHAVDDAFHAHQKTHPRSTGPTFADKKEALYLPLQAADMVAYRTHFTTGKWVEKDPFGGLWPEFDEALFRPIFVDFKANRAARIREFLNLKLNS